VSYHACLLLLNIIDSFVPKHCSRCVHTDFYFLRRVFIKARLERERLAREEEERKRKEQEEREKVSLLPCRKCRLLLKTRLIAFGVWICLCLLMLNACIEFATSLAKLLLLT